MPETRGAAWRDPAAVFADLQQTHPHVFWLDAGPGARAGWSAAGWGEPDDPARVRAAAVAAGPSQPLADGGWVGWCGYEAGTARAGAPSAVEPLPVPAERWLRARCVAVWDHARRRMTTWGELREASGRPSPTAAVPPARGLARARHTPEQYASLIARCRERIAAGDAYQLCLTTRFEVDGAVDPVAAHLALRQATPAHHGGIIRSGDVALVSASPERFLHVDGDRVRTHPIKGTRSRGADAASDAALAAELRASAKERAENTMIVDLMRNDLARVCEPGTVEVDRLLEVEHYPAVHQLVSAVSGRIPAGLRVGELLDGTFPAGSMTGAPKLSAMTILHGLEGGPRGVYSGCFGWVGASGGLDLAMVIRSIVTHPGGAYVGAGGGITWGSDAAAEVAEVGVKARAPLAAIGAAVPPGW